MAKIKNMGTATMRFNEGIIITGSAGTDTRSLLVTGSTVISGSASHPSLDVYNDISNQYVAIFDNDASSNSHGMKITTDGTGTGTNILDVESGTTNHFRIRGDGRVGIGKSTSLPAAILTVSSSNADSDIAIAHKIHHIGDSDTYMDFPSNDNITFTAGGSEELKIASDAILVKQYIKHDGDEDTNIRLQTDQIDITAGGKTMLKLEEGSQNKLSLGLDSSFGTDTFLSVSGSLDGQNLSVFGGSVMISGSLNLSDAFTFPTTDGNSNQVLTTDGVGNLTFQAQATGSGANPPGGSDRHVQFNDNGSFAGNYGILVDSNFNLKVSGSLISKESIGVGTDLGGGRNDSDEWVAITAPQHKFHVIGDNTEAATFSIDSAANSVGGAYWSFAKARGTPSSPAAVNTNDEIARIQFLAYTGSSTLKRSALIMARADSDGDGRLGFYVTKEGDVDNIAIECYNNQVTIQDQMVIGASGIIPLSNGGASIGGSSSRFDYMRANNLVAYESLMLGGTHPIYDKTGFGVAVNKTHLPIGNYTSGEGFGYMSNSTAVDNVMFVLQKSGSHFGGMGINGHKDDDDELVVFFSENNTAGFQWRNNIPLYGANGMGNLTNTGTTLMNLDKDANLLVSGTMTVGAFTIPKTDGTNGQVLKTNGSGVLAWADDTSGSSSLTVGFSTIGGASGSVDHDCTSNQTFYHNYISGAISPNFTNLSISSGQATVTKLILDQGATPYAIDKVSIAGTEASLVWEGSRPSVISNAISFAKFEILRISNSYSVIGAFATTVAGGPVTIPNNALLFLDASNGNSYPGSGTTWTDLSGEGKHGTLVNTPTWNSSKKLFEFSGGSSQHITVPAGFNDFSSGATFFVVADLGTGSSWERFFDFSVGGATNDAFNFGRKNTTTNLSLQFYHVEEANANISLESNQISNDTLANYAITTDGTNARVYKNGVLVETISFAATLSDVERNQNYIGRSRAGGNAYYEGDLAVAAIFNRTLTATEIADLYTYYSAVYDI